MVECQICFLSFEHVGKLKYHVKQKHSKPKRKLQMNSFNVFFTFFIYAALVLKYRGPYFCDRCGSKSSIRESLMHHFRAYCVRGPNKRHFICDLCGHTDSRQRCFQLHMSRHRSKINCKICNRAFLNIDKHSKIHEKASSKTSEQNAESQSTALPELESLNYKRVLRR